MELDTVSSSLRKLDFPASAEQGIKFIHTQCEKFSQSGMPSPGELTSLIEFIDEFLFCTVRLAKSGKKSARKLSSLQQLHLVQILADYFTGEVDFSLLCSVFMIIFMVQGKDVEYKINCLAKLLSYGLSVNAPSILNFGGVWLTQQKPTSSHSLQVARLLVQDTVCCPVSPHLSSLPVKSPLFTTNLMAAVGELYSRVTVTGDPPDYTPPPPSTLALISSWLGSGQGKTGAPLSVPGTSPAAGLLCWPVLGPLLSLHHHATYSTLQHCLVDNINNSDAVIPLHYLLHLTRLTLATLARKQGPEYHEVTEIALDRFGQLMTAVLASGRVKADKELELMMRKLPPNRMVQIVIKTYF